MPFAKLNPPVEMLAAVADKHAKFFVTFVQQLPHIEIVNLKTESVAGGLTRISLDVHNRGLLPSHSELGNRIRWIGRLKIKLNISGNQQVVSGKAQQLLREAIPGNGTLSFSWLVSGTGNLSIEVGSASTGTQQVQVKLQ